MIRPWLSERASMIEVDRCTYPNYVNNVGYGEIARGSLLTTKSTWCDSRTRMRTFGEKLNNKKRKHTNVKNVHNCGVLTKAEMLHIDVT